MNKVIAAFDALKPSKSVMDGAVFLQKNFDAYIIATFLEEVAYRSEPVGVNPVWPYGSSGLEQIEQVNIKDEKLKEATVLKVRNYFLRHGLDFKIHQDKYVAYGSLLVESRYADLILIDDSTSFSSSHTAEPSSFLQDLLMKAHCPILLVPQKFQPFEKVIIAYDESEASTYALKEFLHLFPKMDNKTIDLVTIRSMTHSPNLLKQALLQELIKTRYPHAHFKTINSELNDEIALVQYIREQKNKSLIVLGAYGRSFLSMLFKKSTADRLLRELDIPLFIAHP